MAPSKPYLTIVFGLSYYHILLVSSGVRSLLRSHRALHETMGYLRQRSHDLSLDLRGLTTWLLKALVQAPGKQIQW